MGKRIELTQVYRKPPTIVADGRRLVSRPRTVDAKAKAILAELAANDIAPVAKSKRQPTTKKAKKPKPTKSKTSPSRKIYLAAKAKERRAAVKAGLSLKEYRIQNIQRIQPV